MVWAGARARAGARVGRLGKALGKRIEPGLEKRWGEEGDRVEIGYRCDRERREYQCVVG